MQRKYKIIDGHAHVLPNPDEIPDFMKEKGYFNIEEKNGLQFMTQPFMNWSRPISHPTFFIHERLKWMQKHNIAHSVMITLSQFYCNTIPDDDVALEIMQFQNDFHLGLQKKYPLKLSCGILGLPRLEDETLVEIECRRAQGMKFLCLPTHYKRKDGRYISSTDENCQKIFELANKLGLPIQIHPYDYEQIYDLVDIDVNWSGHKAPMPSLTAHFYERLITQGLHKKYPNVRFYLSHGNSVGIATIGRQEQAYKARPDLRNEFSESPLEGLKAKNIFVDSIVHDIEIIRLLKIKIGSSQIIHGIDSPYPLGDGIDYLDDGKYPGCTIDDAMHAHYISEKEALEIFSYNVFDWLYGTEGESGEYGKKMKKYILDTHN